jgi:hypothetical protein
MKSGRKKSLQNSNNSRGTFLEGAIVAGYPTDAAEDTVMQNVQSVGYGR